MEDDLDPLDYEEVGWYHVVEARRLLRDLEASGIRFFISSEHSDPVHGDQAAASMGGSFGASGQVLLHVHNEDRKRFREIHDKEFLREPTIEPGLGIKLSTILKILVIVGIGLGLGRLIANSLEDETPQEPQVSPHSGE